MRFTFTLRSVCLLLLLLAVQLYVDSQAEAVLLPINDQMVPFHISTIKNAHKCAVAVCDLLSFAHRALCCHCRSEEADGFMHLRLTFNVPGTSQAALAALPVRACCSQSRHSEIYLLSAVVGQHTAEVPARDHLPHQVYRAQQGCVLSARFLSVLTLAIVQRTSKSTSCASAWRTA